MIDKLTYDQILEISKDLKKHVDVIAGLIENKDIPELNDFVATVPIDAENIEDFRQEFMDYVYRPGNYRRISKSEACRIQGFPDNYILPPHEIFHH